MANNELAEVSIDSLLKENRKFFDWLKSENLLNQNGEAYLNGKIIKRNGLLVLL